MFSKDMEQGGKALFSHLGPTNLVEAVVLIFYDDIEPLLAFRMFGKIFWS